MTHYPEGSIGATFPQVAEIMESLLKEREALRAEICDLSARLAAVRAVREQYLNQQITGGWDWLHAIDAALDGEVAQ